MMMKSNFIANYMKSNLFHRRILKFSMVGAIGVMVNTCTLYVLTDFFQILYMISSIFAIEISILSNFFLNNIWTWKDRKKKSLPQRIFQYHISVGIVAILANWLLLILLTELLGLYYLFSNLVGIGVGTLANFVINDLWTFRQQEFVKDIAP